MRTPPSFPSFILQFLHWYHHITVLLFCWHSYAVTSSTGLYFVAMNFSVHAVMYGYYYLVRAFPPSLPPSLVCSRAPIFGLRLTTTPFLPPFLPPLRPPSKPGPSGSLTPLSPSRRSYK